MDRLADEPAASVELGVRHSLAEQWQINQFLWICLVFLAAFLPVASARGWMAVPLRTAYAILGVAAVNAGFRTYAGWRRGGSSGELGWLFTSVDVALIAVGVHLTGGFRSELWLVYFVLMISESMFAGPKQTSALILMIASGYLAGTWGFHRHPDYSAVAGARLFFLVLVGMFARRLSANRERQMRQLSAMGEQVAASEERARIAREVHDSLGHALVSTILRLELASRLMQRSPGEAEAILKEEVPALRAAWNEGRNLAFHLRPWEPDPHGFLSGLRRNVGRFTERTGLTASLELPESEPDLARDVDLAATRIIQEALTNVARHSGASSVRLRLSMECRNGRSWLTGEVCDDGCGFDGDAPAGFGLQAMRERAASVGGALHVAGRQGEGTVVAFELPLRGPDGKRGTGGSA